MALPHPTVQINRPLTADDLAQMPDDGNRYEIIEGELFVSAAPTPYHQRTVHLLDNRLGALTITTGLGAVFTAPIEVRLSPRTAVEPDRVFIARERGEIIDWTRRINGAPDLVVEVVSPSNPAHDTVVKARVYAAHGVQEYWIFDPIARDVAAYTLTAGRYVAMPLADGRLRSQVLAGFELDTADFFRQVYMER